MRPKPLPQNLWGALRTLTFRRKHRVAPAALVLRSDSLIPNNLIPKMSKSDRPGYYTGGSLQFLSRLKPGVSLEVFHDARRFQ